ncbi:formylglycine-generating enzyme family protein [Fibrobacterota bacterium]
MRRKTITDPLANRKRSAGETSPCLAALFLTALVLVAESCKEREFNNPFDPESPNYVGDENAVDGNDNGFADALEPELVLIPGGCFTMGREDTTGEDSLDAIIDEDEQPGHKVCVDSFYVKTSEVTVGEFRTVFPERVFEEPEDSMPATKVSWYDAVEYCNRLSELHDLSPVYSRFGSVFDFYQNGFRLPTEAEWEYAYGSDSGQLYHWGNADSLAGDYAWFNDNSGGRTHLVKQLLPNRHGLYDMAGNVWEWVNDWYGDYTEQISNPQGPLFGTDKVARGASWNYYLQALRASNRRALPPEQTTYDTGFRIVGPGRFAVE